jgi:hypothetical protein
MPPFKKGLNINSICTFGKKYSHISFFLIQQTKNYVGSVGLGCHISFFLIQQTKNYVGSVGLGFSFSSILSAPIKPIRPRGVYFTCLHLLEERKSCSLTQIYNPSTKSISIATIHNVFEIYI